MSRRRRWTRIYTGAVKIRWCSRPKKWTAERRLRIALANNNGGMWWVARARRTVADVERRFTEGSVGRVLFDTMGGLLGDHRALQSRDEGFTHYLYVQLLRCDADVTLCLREIGIAIIEPIPFDRIRHY